MPLTRVIGAFIVALAICVVALPRCMTTTPAQGFEQADAVFRGRVTNIGFHWFSSTEPVTFAVEQSSKGIDSNQVVVYAAPYDSEGYRFQSGTTYIVYAYLSDGKLYTSMCSHTHE